MDKAYTSDYQLIGAKDAVKGRRYFCPNCAGILHFYLGNKQISHFRHARGVPDYQKEACELYSNKLGEGSIYNQEIAAKQSIRLIIEKSSNCYIFKVKFPIVRQEFLQMQIQNKYFSYHCQEIKHFDLNTVRLLPSRAKCEEEVKLLGRYTFTCTNETYEEELGLQISGIYEPLSNGPLIFKEIQGQFISIPYRRLTLSGRFFVVSYAFITIPQSIEVLNKIQMGNFFVYELIMPLKYSDDLKNWFTKVLCYTLEAATCHIDLINPNKFKKNGTTFELSEKTSIWQLTNIGERPVEQGVIIVSPNLKRNVLKVNERRQINIYLEHPGDYTLFMDQEVTEILTLRYNPNIIPTRNFKGALNINKEDILFYKDSLTVTEPLSIKCNLPFFITSDSEIDYEIQTEGRFTNNLPLRLEIPTLWSVKIDEPTVEKAQWSFENILYSYERQLMYPKAIGTIMDLQLLQHSVTASDFIHKDKLLYYIRRLGQQMPKPIIDYIQEMKRQR